VRRALIFTIAFAIGFIVSTQNISVEAGFFDKEEVPSGWQEERSTHFIIYFDPVISPKYVRKVVSAAEDYYTEITDKLGLTRFDFWLWEDRTKIFLYSTQEEYQQNLGQPDWTGAAVDIRAKKIYTYYLEEKFFNRFLPHELGHIIFREFVGMDRPIPLWLNEGVACSQEEEGYLDYLATAKGFIESKMYFKISELKKVNQDNLTMPAVFYAQSASIVIFLQNNFKAKKFTEFCKELRDENPVQGALARVYKIKDDEDLERQWLDYMKVLSYRQIWDRYGSADISQ